MLLVFVSIIGCKEEFLDPDPLSFYTPDNALNDADGDKQDRGGNADLGVGRKQTDQQRACSHDDH